MRRRTKKSFSRDEQWIQEVALSSPWWCTQLPQHSDAGKKHRQQSEASLSYVTRPQDRNPVLKTKRGTAQSSHLGFCGGSLHFGCGLVWFGDRSFGGTQAAHAVLDSGFWNVLEGSRKPKRPHQLCFHFLVLKPEVLINLWCCPF